jgi:3-oxoacyl-[acyl-carrier protein] reductase
MMQKEVKIISGGEEDMEKKKTVLVTGASGGIGGATALLFAQRGYRVALHYNKGEARCGRVLNRIADFGGQALAVRADIACEAQVKEMFAQVRASFGDLDVLVNNAGTAQQKLIWDITEADWDAMFAVNMKGMFFCSREAAGGMVSKKSGKIINVSSVWGICGASMEVHYSAAKAAAIGFTRALAKEIGPSGVQVNCVAPGVIDTPMNAHLDETAAEALKDETPLGRFGTPEDVAQSIFFLASSEADFITGQVLSPNGGFVI